MIKRSAYWTVRGCVLKKITTGCGESSESVGVVCVDLFELK